MEQFDVVVIGGGQSGLSVGHYLERTNLEYVILDREAAAGGGWRHTWDSLRLFSPAKWSSLPGTIMKGGTDHYPTRDDTIAYLKRYEAENSLKVRRPVLVRSVAKNGRVFQVATSEGDYEARAVVSATGTLRNPFVPDISAMDTFKGTIIHSSRYRSPDEFSQQRVAVVGGGNSGAQILAEVSKVADTLWVTKSKPSFLPEEVDGRHLFEEATKMYKAKKKGKDYKPFSLDDIVMVDSVREARERGVLDSRVPQITQLKDHSVLCGDGKEERADAVIFCTGFRPVLGHLQELNILRKNNRVETAGTQATDVDGLWLVGYGNWTGFASATLVGVGRSARKTVDEIREYLRD